VSSTVDLGARPPLGYCAGLLDRAAERRSDAAALDALLHESQTAAYLLVGERVVLRKRDEDFDPLFAVAAAQATATATESVFLGLLDGAARFAIALDPAASESLSQRADLALIDLRSLAVQGLVDGGHLAALAGAKSLLLWHAQHRHCARCGALTRMAQGGWQRDCPACDAHHFPRTDPVVIMLATAGDRCVLGRQARFAPGMWSCLAGFVEPGETIEDAVRRETREEAGIACGRVDYFASQPWPFPASLMIGCHGEALSYDIVVDRAELEDARWFVRDEVVTMLQQRHPQGLTVPPPIAIAHHLIRAWVEDGRGRFG
jgi:NAD+ diphosphatase